MLCCQVTVSVFYGRWHVLLQYSQVVFLSIIMLAKGIVQRFNTYVLWGCQVVFLSPLGTESLSLDLDRPVHGIGLEW
jgi:hypothetical protein